MSEFVSVRFVLNVPTEDPAYVDVDFADEKQALTALTSVTSADSGLVAIDNAYNVPVILRRELIAAAFPVEFEDDEEEDDEDDDGDEETEDEDDE